MERKRDCVCFLSPGPPERVEGRWEDGKRTRHGPMMMMLLGQDHSSPQDRDTVSGGREDKIATQVNPLHK